MILYNKTNEFYEDENGDRIDDLFLVSNGDITKWTYKKNNGIYSDGYFCENEYYDCHPMIFSQQECLEVQTGIVILLVDDKTKKVSVRMGLALSEEEARYLSHKMW